ncbi:MAG: tetratricopeptide repeat protein, partial [Shewanella sp.]|nr:tetratricopeptide repeat protein [Shewanella sp.]
MTRPHFNANSPSRFDSTEMPRDRDSEPIRNDIGRNAHEQYSAVQSHEESETSSINCFHSSTRGEQVSQPSDSSQTANEETQDTSLRSSMMARTVTSPYGSLIGRRQVRAEENYPIQQTQSLHDRYELALTALENKEFQQVLMLVNTDEDTLLTDDIELLDNIDFILTFAYRQLGHSEKMNLQFFSIIDRHSTGSHSNVLLAKYHLGGSYLSKQEYTRAAQYFHEAEPYFTNPSAFEADLNSRTQSCIAKPSKITYYIQLGNTYKLLSNFEKSEMYFKKALAEAEQAPMASAQMAPLTSLGILQYQLGNYPLAIPLFEKSLHFANEQKNNDSLYSAHNNLGNSYIELGDLAKATSHFIEALRFALRPEDIARAHNALGNAYQHSQQIDSAKDEFSKALIEATKVNNSLLIQQINGNIAVLYIRSNDYLAGIKILEDMLVATSGQSINMVILQNLGSAKYNLAVSLLAGPVPQGKIDLSVPQSSHSKIIGDQLVYILHNPNNSNVEEVNEARELLAKANQHFTTLLKGVFKGITEQQRGEPSFLARLQQCQVSFNRLQDSLMLLGKYEQALAIAEQSRSKNLLAMLAENGLSNIELDPATQWPLSSDFIIDRIRKCKRPVNYISYTGNRLNIWHFNPQSPSDIQVYSVFLDKEY